MTVFLLFPSIHAVKVIDDFIDNLFVFDYLRSCLDRNKVRFAVFDFGPVLDDHIPAHLYVCSSPEHLVPLRQVSQFRYALNALILSVGS